MHVGGSILSVYNTAVENANAGISGYFSSLLVSHSKFTSCNYGIKPTLPTQNATVTNNQFLNSTYESIQIRSEILANVSSNYFVGGFTAINVTSGHGGVDNNIVEGINGIAIKFTVSNESLVSSISNNKVFDEKTLVTKFNYILGNENKCHLSSTKDHDIHCW